MGPIGPCFEVGPDGYFSFHPEFTSTMMWTALGAFSVQVDKYTIFDRDGRRWRTTGAEAQFRKSWWRVLLAHTVYNPRIPVTILWAEPTSFDLSELKQAFLKAVDNDDDIFTQFFEETELKKRISDAHSFDGLIEVYQWMKTEHSHEKEQGI
jgi:hypothetical protein